jgi:polyisoprenoid-binding protein YceI
MKVKEETKEIDHVKVQSTVSMSIAGITRDIVIEDGTVVNHSENAMTLSGNLKFNLSDFGVRPPEKFWGMVRVEQAMTVSFCIDLDVKPIN